MLKPPRRGEPLLAESPPPQPPPLPQVFGKPWYWQRSSGSMEGSRGLAHVIMEMRDEIKKLEAENRQLRGHGRRPLGAEPVAASAVSARAENASVNLRRNASAPALELEGQYKENTIMTVRRYSISANLSGVTVREGRPDPPLQTDSGWGRLQQDSGIFANSARGEVGKASNRHSLQEYVHKNRAKVKTVTFLLPVDDIYTSRPVLSKPQEEPKITELASIAETDS